MKKIICILVGLAILFIMTGCGELQKVKINSIEITNIYRNCEKNNNDNYIDTTILATIDVDVTKNNRYSEPIVGRDCILKLGPDTVESFALTAIPAPQPYVEGIDKSGLYMVTGGELKGDSLEVLTFCCQDECDTANVALCK